VEASAAVGVDLAAALAEAATLAAEARWQLVRYSAREFIYG